MKKVLFAGSTITDMNEKLLNHLEFFHRNGYTVHLLGKDTGINVPYVDQIIDFDFFEKTGFNKERKLIKQLQDLLIDEKYTAVISYEDIPGYFIRMSGRSAFRKFQRPKMFHLVSEYPFYENPEGQAERKSFDRQKRAGKTTDLLIVCNDTDVSIAEKYHFSQDKLVKLYGLGVPSIREKISSIDKVALRKQYQLTPEHFVAFYDNLFEEDKNHRFLIENILPIINHFPHFKMIFNGSGSTLNEMKSLAEKENVSKNILFLEKEDPSELYALSDLYISPSLIEGIPFGIVHALEMNLPVLASEAKGNVDLIRDGSNGILFGLNDYGDFTANLYVLLQKNNLLEKLKKADNSSISNYFPKSAEKHIFNYYRKVINDIDSFVETKAFEESKNFYDEG